MKQTEFDKNMSAITFAEAGEHDTALEMLGRLEKEEKISQPSGKPWSKAIVLGAVSLASYIFLFMNQDKVMDLYTKGGVNTAYPIITVFWFSFIHGGFASNLLTCLGIEAKSSH